MSPGSRPETLASLTFVSPAAAVAASVVVFATEPTFVTVLVSRSAPVSTASFCPTAKPLTLLTLRFVAPAADAALIVVGAPAAVPTAVMVPVSRPAPVSTATGAPTA